MKIGFIDVTVTMSYGGIQTAVWELAKVLSDEGHEVHIFGGEGDIRPELGGRPVKIHTFPYIPRKRVLNIGSRFQKITERYSFARHARHQVQKENLDWIILTKPFDFFWPRLLPKETKTKFCFMSGGTSFFRGDRKLSQRLDAWVACSHFNAWQIQHHYKQFPSVIYNGVDTTRFKPMETTVRQMLGIHDDTFLVAFAGRLVGWKGVRYAVDAIALLKNDNIKLLVIGAGDDLPALQRRAAEKGVQDCVIFHPPVSHDELPAWYAAADAGVFPSIGDEAFGITIAEAMACGKPVIGSYIGGIAEVIGNEEQSGLLVPPGNAQAIADAMKQLYMLPDRGKEMGENARLRIVGRYTWQHSSHRLLRVLNANNDEKRS